MTKKSSYDMTSVLEMCLQIIAKFKVRRADNG